MRTRRWRAADRQGHQADPSTDLFFVESGRVAIQLEVPGQAPVRLRSMGPGTVIGEVALYLKLPRSASVVAETDSSVYRLTLEALHTMQQQDPGLAAALHKFIVRLLAKRLNDTNKLLSAVLD
jgi:SulP family sulfate permease